MTKKRIIVVDDERDIVNVVKKILESKNFDVIPTYSGEECLDKLKKEKPDLIILDVFMPGMDGWEAFKRIRSINKDQKVIFLTAVGATEHKLLSAVSKMFHTEKIKEWGAVDYITKPFDNKDLVRRVKRALGE